MWYVRSLTEESLHFLHERVVEEDPNAGKGYTSKGLVGPCMDRAVVNFYGETQYEDIYERTAALIQGIINFHPFTDGNKRTALLAAYFFLFFHGYRLDIVYEEVIGTFVDIANEEISEVKDIADWVKRNTRRLGRVRRFLVFIIRLRTEEIDLESTLGEANIATYFLTRIEEVWPED